MFYVWFRVSFDTQYVLCLSWILMMFYVWFRVSFDTQDVLVILSRYPAILDIIYVTFQGYCFGSVYGYCLQGSG